MKATFRVVMCVACLSAAAVGQSVSYEKYSLDNGLTVILHEDHSLPIACVNLWYYVASKDEPVGRSGFAHLFEHLMFMGTHRVPGADFDNIMEAGGGWNNATTSEDRTNYFDMGPAELLPTLLWLEADRLESLGEAMTQEKLDKQRAVVRNERRQSYENAPYGDAELRIYELMFPEGHPYHIPVIGTHEDLEAATVDDVKNFFATFYVPSNLSLVVAGDFKSAEIKPLIEKLFGTLPRGSDVVHRKADPVRLSGVQTVTMTDQVQFARTSLVFHSPRFFAPGDAEMDIAAAVLSSGISSRLYQKLVYDEPLAVSVNAYQSSMLVGSLFYIEATARPGVSLEKIEATIDEVLAEFVTKGPTDEELERQKAQIEFRTLSRLQSLLAKADRLNQYQFFFDEPNSFKRDLDRYRTVTADRVREWASRVLTPNARLVMRVIPEIQVPEENPRDAKPVRMDAPDFELMEPNTFTLSNGIMVHHWPRGELPLVAMKMMIPVGSTADRPDQSGLCYLTAEMLDEGAGDHGAIEFADALEALGATMSTEVDLETTSLGLTALSRNFGHALDLFADAVLKPRFDEKEWSRVHSLHMQELVRQQDLPQVVAARVAMRALFGDLHPYSRPSVGTAGTVESITLDRISEFYKQLFRPTHAVFLVAGDMPTNDVKRQLERRFGGWHDPRGVTPATTPAFPKPMNSGFSVAVVDRPEAVQTVVRFMMPGPAFANPNRSQLNLLNTILGGSFTSRLNQNLREAHGYTYGARSAYSMNPSGGYFSATSSVRTDVTGASIGEFLREFKAIRSGDVSSHDTAKSIATQKMRVVQSFQGLNGILNTAATLLRNERPFSELADELTAITHVTNTELNALANTAIPLERGVLVLVGDKDQILSQISDLDLPTPVEVTVTGEHVVK